ncbi:winged helix-turn-helix domain-containing protein [Candidatus Sumerlaeota bacterium]|nr:winged helix-turn-helix domain-containing protein [Candidatus Sumerlaeota bacterium]
MEQEERGERKVTCILPEGLRADEAVRRLRELADETGMRIMPQGGVALNPRQPGIVRLVIKRASTGVVILDGREVLLTPTEFRLLSLLAGNAGEGVPYERIEQAVWEGVIVERQQIGFHRRNLEDKLRAVARHPQGPLIETHVRWGIRLCLEREDVRFDGGMGLVLRSSARIIPLNFIAREVG